ncbi:MAG: type II toxin-antitoxin system prevent-host-death family antitoxin [Actinomycetota bacterium]|nr:type II toxin-antitoxin system prevent-host-death family antitoxin [Actinomycetota bacterium]
MSLTVSVTEARASLPQILERVLAGEEVTLTRHGAAVAVVVRPDVLRVRRAGEALERAERIHELLESSRRRPLEDGVGLTAERAEELVADVRASRDGR